MDAARPSLYVPTPSLFRPSGELIAPLECGWIGVNSVFAEPLVAHGVTYGESKVNIMHTAKAVDRSITLWKDDKDNYFILAAKDCMLNMGAHLGGVGGSSVVMVPS